jgi:hypothetical protein
VAPARPPFATCKPWRSRKRIRNRSEAVAVPFQVFWSDYSMRLCTFVRFWGVFFIWLSFLDGVSGGCVRECENASERDAAWWNLALFEVPCVMRTGRNDQIFQSGFSFRFFFLLAAAENVTDAFSLCRGFSICVVMMILALWEAYCNSLFLLVKCCSLNSRFPFFSRLHNTSQTR